MSGQAVVIAPQGLMDGCCTDDLVHHLVDTAKYEHSMMGKPAKPWEMLSSDHCTWPSAVTFDFHLYTFFCPHQKSVKYITPQDQPMFPQ